MSFFSPLCSKRRPTPPKRANPSSRKRLDAGIQRHADGGERVQDVVAARLTQRHLTKLFALDEDIETVDDPTLQYFRPDVVAGAKSVGHDRTLHAGQQALHAGVVAAHDVQP